MQELLLICEREIPIQQEKASSAVSSFRKSLQSIKLSAEQTAQDQEKLGQLKARLRELEDDLVKALAVKTRKEAKRMAIADSISATKARTEELKKIVQNQTARKDEYAAIISQQSLALATLEEKGKEETKHKEEIEDRISWYNRVLGFRIEGGHGVKFIFNKINLKNPHEEYSFTVRHADNTYTLLDCDPYLEDTKELVQELNRTNGLFKFVRIMRDKFQAAASIGVPDQTTSIYPDSSTISISAPASSMSVDGSESPKEQSQLPAQPGSAHKIPHKKVNHSRVGKSTILSPASASSLRRSPRFKVSRGEILIKF
ncbi:Chromosome segregation protein Spc25 [Macleaya cordata]|uniref:Kinetochore protein SPC25 n=1 Tax=Macleaya cordata TaxID=56857 RepID=A0A200RDH6_MACCD|nr:Chromosome segregation protein Spc25 [Macleaya cordata]